jgi:hypothetical protein
VLVRALAQGNWRLLAAALDIAVPPLALLGLALTLTVAVSALAVLFGAATTALAIAATSFFAYVVALFLCWLKFGRDVLPLRSLPAMVRFIADKFAIYRGIFTGNPAKSWVRTDRKK